MANARRKNAYYVNETGTCTVDALKPIIRAISITPSAADSRVIIKESNNGTVVIDFKIATNESRFISFESLKEGGIEVTSTFEIDTLSSIESVILYGDFLAKFS